MSSRLMPASTAARTVATHSSSVVTPQSMPIPPPPSVSALTGGSEPKGCSFMMSLLPMRSSASRRVRGLSGARGAAEPAADHHVEGRREDQAEAGDAEHPEEHRGAERLPHLGAGAGR